MTLLISLAIPFEKEYIFSKESDSSDYIVDQNCDPVRAVDAMDLNILTDNYSFPCAVFDDKNNNLSIKSGFVSSKYGKAPVIVYSKIHRENEIKSDNVICQNRIILYLIGGPGDGISYLYREDNDKIAISIAKLGCTVVKFGYFGTNHRSLYPNNDIEYSINEIYEFINKKAKEMPHVQFDIFGESLGGVIAIEALDKYPDIKVDRLFIVNPLFQSPKDYIISLKYYNHEFVNHPPLVRINSILQKKNITVSQFDMLESFFGHKRFNMNLAKYMKKTCSSKVTIIYGGMDKKIGKIAGDVNSFKCLIYKFDGMAHAAREEIYVKMIVDKIVIREQGGVELR